MSYHNNRDGFYRMLFSLSVMFVITNIAGLFVKFGYPAWGFGVLIIGGMIVILSIVFYEDSLSLQTVFRWLQQQFATRNKYREQGLDPNRVDGDRPYKHLDDETVKDMYVESVSLVRDTDEGGLNLSVEVDRGSLLRQEWVNRGNDTAALDQALQDAGHEVVTNE